MLQTLAGFIGGVDGKEFACDAGDPSSIPGLGRSPGEGNGNPLQYSCLENHQGQRSLVGYSPWGCKESDTTEKLTHFCCKKQFKARPMDIVQILLVFLFPTPVELMRFIN